MRPGPHLALALVTAAALSACARVEPPAPAPPAGAAAEVPDLPTIDRPVVDATATLDASTVEALAARLRALEARTGAQMAVLIVWTTGGQPIEDYSMRIAEAWRGGTAARDDGLLLTLALSDRRMRLEVGYGLEEAIPDGEALAILDAMRDDLRAGDVGAAVAEAIERVARELPRTGGSVLLGGVLASPDPGYLVGAPIVLGALALALGFVLTRPRRQRPSARWWASLVCAAAAGAMLAAWLHADLGGLSGTAAGSFMVAAAVLLSACAGFDALARPQWRPIARRSFTVFWSTVAAVPLVGAIGMALGQPEALAIAVAGGMALVMLMPFLIGASGETSSYTSGGSHTWSSSATSSETPSSSSSSSSSSYAGRGGGFGGGGASASW